MLVLPKRPKKPACETKRIWKCLKQNLNDPELCSGISSTPAVPIYGGLVMHPLLLCSLFPLSSSFGYGLWRQTILSRQ